MPVDIGITLGDPAGIGPEVVLKALASVARSPETRFTILGDAALLRRFRDRFGIDVDLAPPDGSLRVLEIGSPAGEFGPGSPGAARASLEWLNAGARECLAGRLDALVTGPVNKGSILRAGEPFVGQTEHLSRMAGVSSTAMMLLGQDPQGRWLRVVLATTHIPLRLVPSELTPARLLNAIERACDAGRQLGIPDPRIGVCALNPHAGEQGQIGEEEITLIIPTLAEAQGRGWPVVGPIAADTIFHDAIQGCYDVVVALYHDQGLGPLKLVAFDNGVNWTVGLPFVRTSPDHGTAYDIAGKGIARASSMASAIALARRLVLAKQGPGVQRQG